MTDTTAHKLARIRQVKDAADSQDLEALLEVARALHATLDVQQLLALVVEKAIELTGADRGCLVILQEGGYRVEIARDWSGGALPAQTFRPSRSVLDAAVGQKGAVVVNDVTDTEFGDKASVREMSIRMVLCAPLFVDGKIAGLIYVDSVASGEGFSERRLRTLGALAGQAAVAWQQASLFAEIRALYEKTRILDAGKPAGPPWGMDFIHIASHELRTPLALIRGYVDMPGYLMADGDYTRVCELLGSVSSGVARLTEIVNTMLLASQLDQGGFSRIGEVRLHSTGKTRFNGAGPGLGLFLARGTPAPP